MAEVGAETDASGELVASEEKVEEIGAVSSEAVIENRRLDEIVNKVRGNVKGTQFNIDDPLLQYDTIARVWPPSTLTIYVKRLTGAPKSEYITSHPRSGIELHDAIKAIHGEYEEASYSLKYVTNGGQIRGNGQITMPDTRPPKPPQGQTMQPSYPQQNAPQQPPVVQVMPQATDPMAMMTQMFKIFQQMQQSVQQQQPQLQPAPQSVALPQQPAPGPATDPVAMMQQMFQMFMQMQQGATPTTVAPPPSQAGAPLPAPVSPTDPVAMMQEMFRVFQQVQQGVAPQVAARAPQPVAQPQPAPAPASPDPMAMMSQMFKMFQDMQQATLQAMGGGAMGGGAMGGGAMAGGPVGPAGRPMGPYRGPYRGPQPPYDPSQGGYPQPQQPPPPQPRSAAQEFREAVSVVRTVAQAAEEIRSILPGQPAPQPVASEPEEDVSPVKIMDVGDYKLVLDKKSGDARLWETGWANMGPILKWAGEQREAIQKANAAKPQAKQAPPGYVEVVTPGYGTVLVDPSQMQQGQQPALPPPPAQMPPPIDAQPEQGQRRTWDPPPIPGR